MEIVGSEVGGRTHGGRLGVVSEGTKTKSNLDEVDLQILTLLQRDGRVTNADLAKAVNLSPPSVLQRVRALEKAGLIRGYHAQLDHERLGLRITAMVMITLALHQEMAIERFRRAYAPVVANVYGERSETEPA